MKRRDQYRLPGFDYSTNGAYFVTICTHDRAKLFGKVGVDSLQKQVITQCFADTISSFEDVSCPKFVVMPNHFHALITMRGDGPMGASGPTKCAIVGPRALTGPSLQRFNHLAKPKFTESKPKRMEPPVFLFWVWQKA